MMTAYLPYSVQRLIEVATELRHNSADDIDPRLRYVYIQPDRDEWTQFCSAVDAIIASDQDKSMPSVGWTWFEVQVPINLALKLDGIVHDYYRENPQRDDNRIEDASCTCIYTTTSVTVRPFCPVHGPLSESADFTT